MSEESAAPAAEVSAPAESVSVVSEVPVAAEAAGEAAAAEVAEQGGSEAEQAEAAKTAIQEFKLKVDGEEIDYKIDLNDKEAVKKELQLARAAQKRMQEAADLRKSQQQYQADLNEFIEILKTDPASILADPNIGVDLKEFAEKIQEDIRLENEKSPEEKERERLQSELEKLQREREKEKTQREQLEFQKMQDEAAHQIESEIHGAIENSTLPKSPYVVKKVAEMIMVATQNKVNVSANDVIPIVRRNLEKEIKELFGIMPEELIEEIVGKDRIASLRKKQIARAQTAKAATKVKDVGAVSKEKKTEEKIKASDFFKKLGSY
jgi:hypothetical protein